jgi:hypothetical protein
MKIEKLTARGPLGGEMFRADQFFNMGKIMFSPEPAARAHFPRFIAVAVGSGLNELKTDRPWEDVDYAVRSR